LSVALPPLQDIRQGHEQCTLWGEAMPEPREQFSGLAQMLENMTTDDAIELTVSEIERQHRVEIPRGQCGLVFGVRHSGNFTRNLLLDLPAQRPRSTPKLQHPLGRLADPREQRLSA